MKNQPTTARLNLKKERLVNLSAGNTKHAGQQRSGWPCWITLRA